MVRIREFYQDPTAPRAQDLLPAAFAAVRNVASEVLVVRRIDDGNWELPGGRIEVGETALQAVIREVAEESGVTIEVTGLSGVYSDPSHVLLDPDGAVHQQLALCFHAVPAPAENSETPRPDGIETGMRLVMSLLVVVSIVLVASTLGVVVVGVWQALLLFLWVRFGGAAQGAGPLLPGQGRLRRRGARALRAPLDLRASATPSGRACGQAGGLPGWCAAPRTSVARVAAVKIVE